MDKSQIHLRIIGDVHGSYNIPDYLKRARKAPYSLQLGDLAGYSYVFLKDLNPDHHKVIAGNHDIYRKDDPYYFRKVPNFLSDFGTWEVPNFGEIFYVRGGYSLNKEFKEAKGLWSIEEECTIAQLNEAIQLYDNIRPKFVASHECPLRLVQYVSDPMIVHSFGYSQSIIKTKTNQALDAMFNIHKPDIWVFGHYHTYFSRRIEGTHFICLNEMPEKGHFIDFPEMEDTDLKDHLNPDDPFELDIGGMG